MQCFQSCFFYNVPFRGLYILPKWLETWRVICVVLVARFVASQKDQEEPEAPSEGGSQHWKSWFLIPKKGDAINIYKLGVAEFWIKIQGLGASATFS